MVMPTGWQSGWAAGRPHPVQLRAVRCPIELLAITWCLVSVRSFFAQLPSLRLLPLTAWRPALKRRHRVRGSRRKSFTFHELLGHLKLKVYRSVSEDAALIFPRNPPVGVPSKGKAHTGLKSIIICNQDFILRVLKAHSARFPLSLW